MSLVEKRQIEWIRNNGSTPEAFAFDLQMKRLRSSRVGWCKQHEKEFERYREWPYSKVEPVEYRPLFAEARDSVEHARQLSHDRVRLPDFAFILGSNPSKKVLAEAVSVQKSMRANTSVINVFVHVGLMDLIDRLSRVFVQTCIATADDPIGEGFGWPRPTFPNSFAHGSWHCLMWEISASEDGQDTLHKLDRRFNCYFDLGHLSQGHVIHGVIKQAIINFVVGHELGHASVGDVGLGYGLYDQAEIVEPAANSTKELQADLFGLLVVWDGLGSQERAERYSIEMTAYGPVLFLAALFSLRYHFLRHEDGLEWSKRLCYVLKRIVWNLKKAGFPPETIGQMSAHLPETAAVTVASLAGVSSNEWSTLRAQYLEIFRKAVAVV